MFDLQPKIRVIFVDLDGTAAEWKAAASPENLLEKGYFRTLAPNANICAAIRDLKSREDVRVYVLTHYLEENPSAISEKTAWVNEHLGQTQMLFVACGHSKAEVAFRTVMNEPMLSWGRHCILLDDYGKNLAEWAKAGGSAVKCLNNINSLDTRFQYVHIHMEPEIITERILSAEKE